MEGLSVGKLWMVGISELAAFGAVAVIAASNSLADQPWWALIVVGPLVGTQVWAWKELVQQMRKMTVQIARIEQTLNIEEDEEDG